MRIRHLKTRKQFQGMLAHPPVARTTHFCMHRMPVSELAQALGDASLWQGAPPCPAGERLWWVGALVPKRWARRAVTRNLIRRQVYAVALEHARSQTPVEATPAEAILIRLRTGFHPGRSGRSRGGKGARPVAAPERSAATPLQSAASPLLKAMVRRQLQQLFERAAQPRPVPAAGSRMP